MYGFNWNVFLTPSVKYTVFSLNPATDTFSIKLSASFDPREKTNYLPHRYGKNCVVYTGTHDNETLVQWYAGLDEVSKAFAMDYMNNSRTPIEEMHWDFIRLAMFSTANTCIIPVQDYMGLGAEARMNFPSTMGNNWKWRMKKDVTEQYKELSKRIYKLTKMYGRL